VSNSVAYAAQRPCIMSGTVKDNILFGLPYDKAKFDETIYLAALGEDLKQLVKGELTEIGEKGINLSGGQKMRVSLARAIYSNR
jgi:ATP-binding cassette, subfamily C (CFTR/MRP), member 1